MDLNRMLGDVERFNLEVVGVSAPQRPTVLSFERGEARLAHIREELTELEAAISDEDLAGQIDAAVDLVYVTLGALVEIGVSPGAAFEIVHRTNMQRRQGRNARREATHGDLDAVKPDGWTPPDFTPLIETTLSDIEWMRRQQEAIRSHHANIINEAGDREEEWR